MEEFVSFVELPPQPPSQRSSRRGSSFSCATRCSSLKRRSTILSSARFYFSYDYVMVLAATIAVGCLSGWGKRSRRGSIRRPSWVDSLLSAGNEFTLAIDDDDSDRLSNQDSSNDDSDDDPLGQVKSITPRHIKDSKHFEDQMDRIYEVMQKSTAETFSDPKGKSVDTHEVDDVVQVLGGISTYCNAQTDLLKILSEESEYLLGIWHSAAGILKDKQNEVGKGERLFQSTADIICEVGFETGTAFTNKKRNSASYRLGRSHFLHANKPPERRGSKSQRISLCRRRSEVMPLQAVHNNQSNINYAAVLQQQADELDTLNSQNEKYDTFMTDCLRIQGIMFQSPDDDSLDGRSDSFAPHPPPLSKRRSRFSINSILPPSMRKDGRQTVTSKVRYDAVSAASYRKTRRHLVNQLREAHEKESKMISQLAAIIGLKEKEVEVVDPHRRRDCSEPWIIVEHLTKQICASDSDIREWLADDVGTPPPERLFINRLEMSSLLFFPTYASHAKGGRLLLSFRQLPLRVREICPCSRCYSAIAIIRCHECNTWMCHFCNLLIHQANSWEHIFVEDVQA
eukprot:TRINITY_DN8540_c0_g1_i1.p1 TRINITY_DN8540_c0_g1~~TRINITY_DN8540_c0_g1_i1.p1  ORF type:complete len:590 (+),score=91.53 TRINITY_DN8540_c0_g1_i1:64-1770(+)